MTAAELYREMHAYLVERGWHNRGGWWWHDDFAGDMRVGVAVTEQLLDEGVELRMTAPLRSQAEGLARAEFQPDMAAAKDAMVLETVGLSLVEPDDHRGEA